MNLIIKTGSMVTVFTGLDAKDVFATIAAIIFIAAIMPAFWKVKDKLNKKVASGQLNKKQKAIFWVELITITSIVVYSAFSGLHQAVSNYSYHGNNFKGDIINGFLMIIRHMQPALVYSLVVWTICVILIQVLKSK